MLNNLDEIVSSEYSGDFAERYKNIMKNQYKNMTYKITDEINKQELLKQANMVAYQMIKENLQNMEEELEDNSN